MDKPRKSDFLAFNDKVFEELYVMDTLIDLAKTSCQEKEFKGQYYGIRYPKTKDLSAERFGYINIFTILADKLSNIKKLSLSIENSVNLQNNTHYSRRQVTA